MESDQAYFARRAAQCREAEVRVVDPTARRAYRELAKRCQDLATSIAARERYQALDLYGDDGIIPRPSNVPVRLVDRLEQS